MEFDLAFKASVRCRAGHFEERSKCKSWRQELCDIFETWENFCVVKAGEMMGCDIGAIW